MTKNGTKQPTIGEVTAEVEKYQEELREDFRMYEKVCEILRTFEGNRITKRLATAVQKALPEGMRVYYGDDRMTWWRLTIWGDGRPYDKKLDYMLEYKGMNGDCFSLVRFRELNKAHALDQQREEALEKAKSRIPEWVNRTNDILKAATALTNDIQKVESKSGKLAVSLWPITKLLDLKEIL